MIAERPKVVLDARYSINDTCKLLQIHRDTLYRYSHVTNEIKFSLRKRGGRYEKVYLGRELLRLWETKN